MQYLDRLGLYAASKVFKTENFYPVDLKVEKYSFNGQIIYDFERKSFARVFPLKINEFRIFDYSFGRYVTVSKYRNNLAISY